MTYNYENIDLSKIYNINELPDKNAGRCDNCNNSHFKSKITERKFLRECSKCGMKKLI